MELELEVENKVMFNRIIAKNKLNKTDGKILYWADTVFWRGRLLLKLPLSSTGAHQWHRKILGPQGPSFFF